MSTPSTVMIMKFVLMADGTYEASNTKGHYSFDSETNAITWLDGPHQKVITKTQIGKRENSAPKIGVRPNRPLLPMLHAETEIEMRMHVSRWRRQDPLYLNFARLSCHRKQNESSSLQRKHPYERSLCLSRAVRIADGGQRKTPT